ncbi:MAG: hypothetical protein FWC95_06835 [Defluviitaleaceae bacterium]|nr:hypothetical protein [Defluviitaleaceae bacterium]
MTDNYRKMVTYNYPDEIPVSLGVLPATWLEFGEDMIAFAKQNKDFFPYIPASAEEVYNNISGTYRAGTHVDPWGCVWSNHHHGMEAIVTGHPVPSREDILTLEIPSIVNGYLPHGFMYLRLLDLRGFEEAMVDFAEECEEIQILIDKVCEFNCIQIKHILPTCGEMLYFGDDLGMQTGLAIGTGKWRKYMKPAFKKMYALVKDAGKMIYMHSDGWMLDIIPDLFECGVDILNPQIRANGLDNLKRICKGKYPLNIDLDRQLFPFATPSELSEHVREVVEEMYLPQGGLGLNIEFGNDVPIENMEAILSAARKMKGYKG